MLKFTNHQIFPTKINTGFLRNAIHMQFNQSEALPQSEFPRKAAIGQS